VGSATTRTQGLVVVGGLALVSICWFLVFGAWWLNSDGSTYLGTGRSALDGLGFRLPDGGAPAWWNRPVYPVVIALPSRFGGGIEASIWMSRVPLMLAAPILAAGTLRLGRSATAAALAGLVAIAQPWTLLAGGSNLVPDGLTSVVTVGAVLAASVGVTSSTRRARGCWLAAAVVCLVLASLTKQTGAAGLLLVGIVVWNGLARPPRWMVVTALALEGVAVFAALVLANGAPEVGLWDLPSTFVDRMRVEVFPGSPAIVVAAAISLFLVAWALPRATQPLPLAGLTVTVAAVALGVYASGNGLQMRNAALLPYGAALLVGSLVAEQATGDRWSRGPRILLGSVLVLSLVAGADARAYSTSDVTKRNWDSEATRGVADFLAQHSDGSTGCTLDYCSFYWLAADQLEMRLLPQYSARPTAQSVAGLDFGQRTGFRGPTRVSPPCTGTPLVVTKSDEGFGAVFECPLLRDIRSEHLRYVVVSGSGGNDTFDAARLIPYLSSNPAFRLVYATPMSAWPRVAAVYRVVGEPRPVPDAPSYYSTAAYDALPGDHRKDGAAVLDGDCYAATIRAALSPPTDAAATAQGAEPAGCVNQ
jgi:hypothetical protein